MASEWGGRGDELKSKLKIIGIGDDGAAGLPPLYREWIDSSEVLAGGERHLAFFPDYEGEKRIIRSGITELIAELARETRSVVLLASGDPLFYGIGAYAARKLDAEVYPALSSIQLAFARMGESWQDAYLASVHGRSLKGLAQRIDGRDKIALLTDAANDPPAIARYLLSFGMTEYRVFVAENLGGAEERTGWYELHELAAAGAAAGNDAGEEAAAVVSFSPLNVVILRRIGDSPRYGLGIDDEAFAQRKPDKGLITKREVRVLSIANLGLREDSVVWDIGTCTGSVAIECGRIARLGQVFAIEKNEADLANCLENAAKFRVDLTAVRGKAPEGLGDWPDPDAVFVGGTGGEQRELTRILCARLRPGGRIVLNAVTIENLYEAKKAFEEEDYELRIELVQVSRSKPILDMTRFEGLNPVYIITAWRKEAAAEEGESER